MSKKAKAILVGLDGATWNLIKPWAEDGSLPSFKKIIQNGSTGGLLSSIPPSSPIAWASIFTGRNPGKHSIFSFVKPKAGSYFIRPISSRDIKSETLWDFLTRHGKRGIYLNIPFSYPIKKINGIITSGLGTPSIKSKFSYPENIKEDIAKKFPNYNVDFEEDLILRSENRKFIIPKIRETTSEHIGLSKYLFKRERWVLFSIVLRSLDVIQHYYWNDKEIILQYYQQIDEFLGWLTENMDENMTLLICSDHGFNYAYKKVCINNWLEKIGLLKVKNSGKDLTSNSLLSAETIQKYLMKLGLKKIVWWAKRSKLLEPMTHYLFPSKQFRHIYQIDWANTKAYYLVGSAGIININLKGREPQGIVESEYVEIRNNILEMVSNLRKSRFSKKPIKRAYQGEEIYHGDQDIPDIFLLKNPGFVLAGGYNHSGNIFQREVSRVGDHEETGVLLAYGTGIKSGKIEGARIYDIAPTILSILKIPIPQDVDGKILNGIFKESLSYKS